MARPILLKKIQVHGICACGLGVVEPACELIACKDFKAFNIKRKKDKKTGQPFLLMNESYESCYNCQPDIYTP